MFGEGQTQQLVAYIQECIVLKKDTNIQVFLTIKFFYSSQKNQRLQDLAIFLHKHIFIKLSRYDYIMNTHISENENMTSNVINGYFHV